MENPSERLCQIITGIEDPREMFHDEVALLSPFLDGKMLDLDVLCTGCGSVFVDHTKRSFVVDQHTGQTRTECMEFRT